MQIPALVNSPFTTCRPVRGQKQAGRLHRDERLSTSSARLREEMVKRNCWTMNLKRKGNVKGGVACVNEYGLQILDFIQIKL